MNPSALQFADIHDIYDSRREFLVMTTIMTLGQGVRDLRPGDIGDVQYLLAIYQFVSWFGHPALEQQYCLQKMYFWRRAPACNTYLGEHFDQVLANPLGGYG